MDQSDEHTNRKVHEKKEVRPREVKVPFENGQNDVSLYRPSSIVHGGEQNPSNIIIEKNDRVLALPSSFSGGLGLEELAEKVKSFMGTTLGKTGDGKRNLYHCKICGKEGQTSTFKITSKQIIWRESLFPATNVTRMPGQDVT